MVVILPGSRGWETYNYFSRHYLYTLISYFWYILFIAWHILHTYAGMAFHTRLLAIGESEFHLASQNPALLAIIGESTSRAAFSFLKLLNISNIKLQPSIIYLHVWCIYPEIIGYDMYQDRIRLIFNMWRVWILDGRQNQKLLATCGESGFQGVAIPIIHNSYLALHLWSKVI